MRNLSQYKSKQISIAVETIINFNTFGLVNWFPTHTKKRTKLIEWNKVKPYSWSKQWFSFWHLKDLHNISVVIIIIVCRGYH